MNRERVEGGAEGGSEGVEGEWAEIKGNHGWR